MAVEIEDKFLIAGDQWRSQVVRTTTITQTYLLIHRLMTVRTRLETDCPAIFCIKLWSRKGGTPEYEWKMPHWLARICSKWKTRTLRKVRHRVPHGELTIEVDEFLDQFLGLIMAEVEKPTVGYVYSKPDWFGQDVTTDKRYKNALLIKFGLPR